MRRSFRARRYDRADLGRRTDDQFEPVRDEQRGYDLESSADVRNVANGAVDCAAAETDGASF